MNDNRQLLSSVDADLRGPILEVLDAMLARRIRVRVIPPKGSRARTVSLEVWGYPVNEDQPLTAATVALADTVTRFNERRKDKLVSRGLKLSFLPPPAEKKK